MKKIKLICIPQAGGISSNYLKWKSYLDPAVELVPIELSGKGTRFCEPLYESIEEAVYDIVASIKQDITNCNYAIFGHSMGALLAFELLYALKKEGFSLPICCFFSGRNPPHHLTYKHRHLLNDEEFWCEIKSIGGTPDEVLKSPEARELFSPILRRDFKLVDTYKFNPDREKINCPFIIMYGFEDSLVSIERIAEWGIYSKCKTNLHGIRGSHFFVFEDIVSVVKLINQYLLQYISLSC